METETQTSQSALQEQAAQAAPEVTTPTIEALPSAVARPEYIPEKFWDAAKGEPMIDKLAVSYAHLEKTLGQKSAAPKKPGADATDEQRDRCNHDCKNPKHPLRRSHLFKQFQGHYNRNVLHAIMRSEGSLD